MERYKRNHILTVIDDFISSLAKSIVPLFILFAGKLREKGGSYWSDVIALAAFLAIVLFLATAAFLKWYKNVHYIDDHFIVMRSGLFVVKRREIPFNKIQTINISQSIIQRIFNLAEMKIDTGNSSYNASEGSIKIRKAEAENIRETILSMKALNEAQKNGSSVNADGIGRVDNAGDVPYNRDEMPDGKVGVAADTKRNLSAEGIIDGPVKKHVITGKELLVSGLTSNAVLAGFAFLASIYGLLNDYLASLLENSLTHLENYIGSLDLSEMALSRIIILIGAAFAVFLVFSFAMSILGTVVKYYSFTVTRDKRNITVSYGLFEKKNYIIPVKKIKAVYVRRNLLRQLVGLYTIYVESIGYGNEKGEEAVLFPIANAGKLEVIFAELLPEYLFAEEMNRVSKTTLGRFIRSYTLFPIVVCIVLSILFHYGWLSFILIPVCITAGYMEYRNSAVGVNNRLICLSNGAFTKSISLVALRDIQSEAERSNYFQRRKGLFNYVISIQSNVFGKTIQVKNLGVMLKENLMGLV